MMFYCCDDRTKWEKFVDSAHIWFDIKIKNRVKPITNKIKMKRLQKKLPKLNKKIDKLQAKSHKLESELHSAYMYDSMIKMRKEGRL